MTHLPTSPAYAHETHKNHTAHRRASLGPNNDRLSGSRGARFSRSEVTASHIMIRQQEANTNHSRLEATHMPSHARPTKENHG